MVMRGSAIFSASKSRKISASSDASFSRRASLLRLLIVLLDGSRGYPGLPDDPGFEPPALGFAVRIQVFLDQQRHSLEREAAKAVVRAPDPPGTFKKFVERAPQCPLVAQSYAFSGHLIRSGAQV